MFPILVVVRRGLFRGALGCSLTWPQSMKAGVQQLQETAKNVASLVAEEPGDKKKSEFSLFPPAPGRESSMRWAGKPFEEIPIVHIKATYNNTHVQVTSHENVPLALSTCGTEGFKNAKKSSVIAAQAAGMAAAAKAKAKGVSHVRIVMKGLGPGRMPSKD
ncbi:28S ribosomal protein S11, mitochondrial isoform X2 [Varanus komodoensis]|uniref:28S ribosomal protein S11, mitochondrial isoform X2 n=1 Tax=Varanus komodoensis TaxID=61221 RepID=UPI001CF7AED1|nr:28S ribosomal protein S11, mitochondrial isoform X2 [Varanus komodoensis]